MSLDHDLSLEISNLWDQLNRVAYKSRFMDTHFTTWEATRLFTKLPNDFVITHRDAFNMAASIAMNPYTRHKIQRLNIILYSPPMSWLRDNRPVECAAVLPDLIKNLRPQANPFDAVVHVLDGEFARRLSAEHPKAYTTMVHELCALLTDADIEKLFSGETLRTDTSVITTKFLSRYPANRTLTLITPQIGNNLARLLMVTETPINAEHANYARNQLFPWNTEVQQMFGFGTPAGALAPS